MKRLAIILVAVGWLCVPQHLIAAISNLQHVQNAACASGGTTCTVVVTSTGAGHLIVAGIALFQQAGGATTLSSVSGGGTYSSCPSVNGADASNNETDCRYTLSSTAGATNIVFTISANATNTWGAEVWEFSFVQNGSMVVDSSNHAANTASCGTSCPGVALTLTGANDVILQMNSPDHSVLTINGGYTVDVGGGQGFAYLANVIVGTAPTWGLNIAGNDEVSAIAFAELPPPPGPAVLTGKLSGQFISGPVLPQVTPSVSYPSEAGYTITAVAGGANLQTAITGAACGTVLSLAHNGSWTTGTAYTLPNTTCACHTDPTKWVILRSDSYVGGSTRGTRIDPSNEYASLAHISSTDANYAFVVTNNGTDCYWFGPGLDISGQHSPSNNAVISWGDGSFAVANYPHDMVVDHSYIHGLPPLNQQRCLMLNGNWMAVVDSYLSDCHYVGTDSQGIVMWDGNGPLLVQNTFNEGAAENSIIGGATSQTGQEQCDLTFKNNHYFKPLSWRISDPTYAGIHWSVKNSFELKGGCRILATGNIFDGDWADGQTGQIVTMKTSTNNWSVVHDITWDRNIVRHAAGAFVIGCDAFSVYPYSDHRILFINNEEYDIDSGVWGSGNKMDIQVGGACIGTIFAAFDVEFNHNTLSSGFTSASQSSAVNFTASTNDFNYGFKYHNSTAGVGATCLFFSSDGCGNGVITFHTPSANFTDNCIYGSVVESLTNPAFNGKQIVANQAAAFTNPSGGDYSILSSSACHNIGSDGLDPGANIAAVNTATSGVVQTLANATTVTNVSPSTFTHAGGTSITITGTNFIVNSGSGESGLGVIVGGAGPSSNVSTVSCTVNTCTVVMSTPITLAVNDTIGIPWTSGYVDNFAGNIATVASVTDTTHFTYTNTGIGTQSWSGGTIHRYTPGNACTSVSVVSATSITCTTPAASGTVTTGPVSIFVSQFGIPVQSTVFGNYN